MSAVHEVATRAPAAHATGLAAGAPSTFADDVLRGLAQKAKSIPCTWLYDQRGSALFDAITRLDAYYPARNESLILQRCAAPIAEAAGQRATLIELGSGSRRKTRLLLSALDAPAAYVPIDTSEQSLADAVQSLQVEFTQLPIMPVVADFTRLTSLPQLARIPAGGRRVVFLPGSTIGNFTPEAATALMHRIAQLAGPDALLVVGADTTHAPAVLIPAYDDAQGVTAAFNKNLLTRMNRELGADFAPSAFRHEARFNAAEQRVEMHLVSNYTQRISVLGRSVHFAMNESIHTENAYKYSLIKFQAMASRAGWSQLQLWIDGQARFAVHVFERSR
jgi:L-histidine Nalpha-methyltransferase